MSIFLLEIGYLICACGFFLGLKFLSSPKSAKKGNALSFLAMLVATLLCIAQNKPSNILGLVIALTAGSIVGVWTAQKVKMTAMPQLVAIFNGLGGLASVLVALAEVARLSYANLNTNIIFSATSWFSIVVGAITFSGSIIAFLKLQELLRSKPIIIPLQKTITLAVCLSCIAALYYLSNDNLIINFALIALLASIAGVLLVLPIGGADMPVVISLLNSYSGVAALAAGFVVKSNILIVSGALVGASGIILTRLMCQAMNRSLSNVVFGAFSAVAQSLNNNVEQKPYKEFSPLDVALSLNNSAKIMIIPGYGLAVSQAQKAIKDLSDYLKSQGITVKYAIHPVAGRMPGHMNVLLAEADIPYDDLLDLEEANNEFESIDTVLLIGANDVVNPLAKTDKTSPLFGMPILEAYKSKSIIVFKRGKGVGFAGVDNPLFTYENSYVIFGDAKASLLKVISSFKDLT